MNKFHSMYFNCDPGDEGGGDDSGGDDGDWWGDEGSHPQED